MDLSKKEFSINNMAVVDPMPNMRDSEISEFEADLIKKYLSKIFKKNIKENIEIELVSSNFFYESYSIVLDDCKYILKVGLTPGSEELKTEANSLKSISDLISPKLIDYTKEKESEIEFLLTTWENGLNFIEYGIDDLVYNFGTFCAVLDFVHESDTSKLNNLDNVFTQNESVVDFFDELEFSEIKIFEKLVDLSLDDVSIIFSKLREQYEKHYEEDIKVFCKPNIKKSGILYNSGYIKLINFENSYTSDIYYSLLRVIYNLEFYFQVEVVEEFLYYYYSNSKIVNSLTFKDFKSNYYKKEEINKIIMFQDLFHEILFYFATSGPFYRTEKLFGHMTLYSALHSTVIKYLPEYEKSFHKLFFTAIPTVDTYDIEELKSVEKMAKENGNTI
jgi:hypothetical protein